MINNFYLFISSACVGVFLGFFCVFFSLEGGGTTNLKVLKNFTKGDCQAMLESGYAFFHFISLGQSPWSMAMCLVWQSVLLGNG